MWINAHSIFDRPIPDFTTPKVYVGGEYGSTRMFQYIWHVNKVCWFFSVFKHSELIKEKKFAFVYEVELFPFWGCTVHEEFQKSMSKLSFHYSLSSKPSSAVCRGQVLKCRSSINSTKILFAFEEFKLQLWWNFLGQGLVSVLVKDPSKSIKQTVFS